MVIIQNINNRRDSGDDMTKVFVFLPNVLGIQVYAVIYIKLAIYIDIWNNK